MPGAGQVRKDSQAEMQFLVSAVLDVQRHKCFTDHLDRGNTFPLLSPWFAHSHPGAHECGQFEPSLSPVWQKETCPSAHMGVRLLSSAPVQVVAASEQSSSSSKLQCWQQLFIKNKRNRWSSQFLGRRKMNLIFTYGTTQGSTLRD